MASAKRYLGLDWIVCVILAIIPFTSLIFGIITRVQRGAWLGAILNFVIFPVFWIVDIYTMFKKKDITFLA